MILSRYFYSTLFAKILINPKLTFDKQIHAGKFNTTVIPLLKKPKVAFQKFKLNNDFFFTEKYLNIKWVMFASTESE